MAPNPFLDLEANVDHGDSEDGSAESDEFECFIDDGTQSHEDCDGSSSVAMDKPIPVTKRDRLALVIQQIEERTRGRSHSLPASDMYRGVEPLYSNADNPTVLSPHGNTDSGFENLPTDYPTWRIGCKVGYEEIAVASLLKNSRREHHIRSAFSRSSVHGYIYLECLMDQPMIDLIKRSPGIIVKTTDVLLSPIDKNEAQQLLYMGGDITNLSVGKWLKVKRGVYKGDVGFVVSKGSWGVSMLMIPRYEYVSTKTKSSRKRKTYTAVPAPKLFDPTGLRNSHLYIESGRASVYRVGDLIFEHGLARVDYDPRHVASCREGLSYVTYTSFCMSGHPALHHAPIPKPKEWIMRTMEWVVMRSTGWLGVIAQADDDNMVDVDIYNKGCDHDETGQHYNETEIHRVDTTTTQLLTTIRTVWSDILKHFEIGDYVGVDAGVNAGRSGWVVDIKGDEIQLIDKQGTTKDQQINTADSMLEAKPTRYDPSNPFKKIVLNRDDVLEYSTFEPLSLSKTYDSNAVHQSRNFANPSIIITTGTESADSGRHTPLPDTIEDTSPAWDPSDHSEDLTSISIGTVVVNSSDGTNVASLTTPCNLLLKRELIGVPLTVEEATVDGHVSPLFVIVQEDVDGQLCMMRFTPNSKRTLRIESTHIKPKHPTIKHDFGLLAIIEGEHAGKCVRRVHSRKDTNGVVLVVKQVLPTDRGADQIVDGELLTPTENCCVAYETQKRKNANRNQMRHEHDIYISTHLP
ncbi:Transcription elongation factor SPT5 [Psilocybe cubensis]|uniref:Transcription elongation factor SPT5 n=6 Tax=Psilocybe cubensis TaxID=181762 RepID=A0ACB8GXX6_PSICU|nr:Transcription elongation factor SPT5 [Psilocybe cubensis]XP_047747911.1 Transcription elongation factor SPT5 [Psilocybe cubensis]XP_047747917.1 Transcription elongation factor SPT5 [Psilocybe cubensis]XP_047749436.1 Transcription elongation factor SPT5 [Psilocybe cubensis]KAH9476619.1 Transcription elongation factor SPT5 [Psilocybe cubensis]KAH9480286.1 Transcription elongation factor SPT5 [Psilocybe cubensis]KAH9480292.1 Transcription elongation factor SPT5 [Psilocybe cubensis]KAH9481811